MSCFFAVLDPPSRKGLVIALAEVVHGGLAGTKIAWDAGKPLLFMCTCHDDEAIEHAERFEALFEWADAHGMSVTIYRSSFPLNGEEIDRDEPVGREHFRNAVEMMKSIADEVAEAMEREAL